MAAWNPKTFTDVDTLRRINPALLRRFLTPYKSYLSVRSFQLPKRGEEMDYETLSTLLLSPDPRETPRDLIHALYLVNEMATPEGMDALLDELKSVKGADHTPADVAIQAWLEDRPLLERVHAERHVEKRRSFRNYLTNRPVVVTPPSTKVLTAMEEAMDAWFEEWKRGRGTRIFMFPRDETLWFVIRHGDPMIRQGTLTGGKSGSVFYRPERHDLTVYDPGEGHLRVNARSDRERVLYRETIGHFLFQDADYFHDGKRFSLEPLREDMEHAVTCSDVEGLDGVTLKEIHLSWGGPYNEIEIRRAKDLVEVFKKRKRALPDTASILRAGFDVTFSSQTTKRSVTIHSGNQADYTRDEDAEVVEEWLRRRGFIVGGEK